MADSFDVQCALRDALSFTFEDGGEIEIPGSTPDYLIMAAAVFETKVSVGG